MFPFIFIILLVVLLVIMVVPAIILSLISTVLSSVLARKEDIHIRVPILIGQTRISRVVEKKILLGRMKDRVNAKNSLTRPTASMLNLKR